MAKLIRCGGVSVTTTFLSLAVLGTLTAGRLLPAGWANVVATVAGIGPSYVLNRRWVWRRRGAHDLRREVLPFWTMSLAALVLSTVAVSSAGRWADHAQLTAGVRTVVVLATNVTVFGSLWIVQFVVLDRVLFRASGSPFSELTLSGDAGRPQASRSQLGHEVSHVGPHPERVPRHEWAGAGCRGLPSDTVGARRADDGART
jgi:putative flippase GtrA